MGVRIAKVYVFFMCNPVDPLISGVRPLLGMDRGDLTRCGGYRALFP